MLHVIPCTLCHLDGRGCGGKTGTKEGNAVSLDTVSSSNVEFIALS